MLAGAAALLAPISASLAGDSLSWAVIKGRIRREFPAVPEITTSELAEWLADPKRPRPILLDVRAKPEFDTSHLDLARQVDPGSAPAALAIAKDTPVVTYCSVGYRSAAFAEKLRAAGFRDVRNLEGSIFQWANEGRPLVSANGRAEKVHPFSSVWGMLLDKNRRSTIRTTR
ncbi:MAG TPA: rhodanese-like domain-containing protein [Chthoniobacteraceae bacterium]